MYLFRSGGAFTASKTADAQAAYESAHTLLPTVLGGVNFALHSAGWMEGGLVTDYAKLLLDADQLTMMDSMVAGIDISEKWIGTGRIAGNRAWPAFPWQQPYTGEF